MPYKNPMEDVPQLRIIYPVPMDHPDYPTVENGSEVNLVRTLPLDRFLSVLTAGSDYI